MAAGGDKMPSLLALDLFCGEGGVCEGLQAAGFEVVGVDNNPKCGRVYPGQFIHGDALNPPVDLADFHFVWASPPCQAFSSAPLVHKRRDHPNLIPSTRTLLAGHGVTCIENVTGAPIRHDLMLTAPTFGLDRIERIRFFELSFSAQQPLLQHLDPSKWKTGENMVVTTHGSLPNPVYRKYRRELGLKAGWTRQEMREVMGIRSDMTLRGIGEAIPPAMATYIGKEAIAFMLGERVSQRRLI